MSRFSRNAALSERGGASPVRDGTLLFFFKQKTAYELLMSLVGSEMCIRDSRIADHAACRCAGKLAAGRQRSRRLLVSGGRSCGCLLYTSDAADDLRCVDLGGRRITKKKKKNKTDKKDKIISDS